MKNAHIITLSPPAVGTSDLRILGGMIEEVGNRIRPRSEEESVDLSGKWVIPGMVCAHTHLYSALARGMAGPKRAPTDFVGILKNIWWKLDEALDEESIYYSALAGSMEAAKHGTTTLFDHHASPNAISGSLDLIKEAMSTVGIRGVLCYETTDRGGHRRRNEALEENERFVRENAEDKLFRGTIGAHASFTLNDDTLEQLGSLAATLDCGVHIHLAEDKADVRDARVKRGVDIVSRLNKHGILSQRSILAHSVHLNTRHLKQVNDTSAWLVHNPRSNMNNQVGHAPLNKFGKHSAIGTDGFPADMFEEAKIGFFRNRESNFKVEMMRFPELLRGGQELASEFFGAAFGTIKKGSVADLVVLDYYPPTPLTGDNVARHFLFGMNSSMVESVMVNGKWIVWDRQLLGLDEEAVMQQAQKAARKLWKRIHAS